MSDPVENEANPADPTPQRTSLADTMILIAAACVALVAVIWSFASGAITDPPVRKGGEPHWTDRIFRILRWCWIAFVVTVCGYWVWQGSE